MQLSFKDLQYVIGSPEVVEAMPRVRDLRPFDEDVLSFLNDLSAMLRKNREYPDVATFGFWCRKAALLQEKAKYDDVNERFGKGIVFHSTPSNVAVNFAFSFASGLLAGNANIVRLPGKPFEQVTIISNAVRELLETKHQNMAPYVVFVKFPPVKEITDAFSALCNVRVIWGGDMTVAELRQSKIQARTTEITFADRHSIAVIDADAYLAAERKDTIVQNFYNDTYYTDQNACTSPCLVVWLGSEIEKAQKIFWEQLHDIAQKEYDLQPVQAVDKLVQSCLLANHTPVKMVRGADNIVNRVLLEKLDEDAANFKGHSGFFMEYKADSLDDILPICKERCQTVSYFGIEQEEWKEFLCRNAIKGVDRIVPIGYTLDFRLTWDGIDFIRRMSREIDIR